MVCLNCGRQSKEGIACEHCGSGFPVEQRVYPAKEEEKPKVPSSESYMKMATEMMSAPGAPTYLTDQERKQAIRDLAIKLQKSDKGQH
jgi:methionyl-tRNA synthetase